MPVAKLTGVALIGGVVLLVGAGCSKPRNEIPEVAEVRPAPRIEAPDPHAPFTPDEDTTPSAPAPEVHSLPAAVPDDKGAPPSPPPLPRNGTSADGDDLITSPSSEPPLTSLPAEEQRRVDQAINKGVKFLRDTQLDSGTWPERGKGPGAFPVGYAALPGLTLLECGVRPSDPTIQKAAAYIRAHANNVERYDTYQMSVSILFLDRLGDPRDADLIRKLALRLVAGQKPTGGWTYDCPELSNQEQEQLLTALQVLTPKNRLETALQAMQHPENPFTSLPSTTLEKSDGPKAPLPTSQENGSKPRGEETVGVQKPPPAGGGSKTQDQGVPPPGGNKNLDQLKPAEVMRRLPESLKKLPVLRDDIIPKAGDGRRGGGETDNSNTQFAMLALWAARRYGIPMDRTMNLVQRRFRTSQNHDGTWSYHYVFGGDARATDISPRGNHGKTMTNVGLLGLAIGHGVAYDARAAAGVAKKQPEQDAMIKKGLTALSTYIGKPAGKMESLSMENLYFLWSVERVAVLYQLKTIHDKDWYRWGAEILVANQSGEGHWNRGEYHGESPTINTCLALLFLKRANLAKDLTNKLELIVLQ